jgi:hypothetical protein
MGEQWPTILHKTGSERGEKSRDHHTKLGIVLIKKKPRIVQWLKGSYRCLIQDISTIAHETGEELFLDI